MADWYEPTDAQRRDYAAWVAERPAPVREAQARFGIFPWKLYRLKSAGNRVYVVSFEEHDGGPVTVKVAVTGRFNFVLFERNVFGVALEDLEECDLPEKGELLGSASLTLEQAREMVGRRGQG